ncbi:CIC_collapsed_G0004030.mRNA.1.CDS.1 [Saccharomyces cerevisiae]|nr:CIC_collapsed_G0004030.mRNA.1.CDS.1 [Saccharomyces cerevisiae]
MTGTPCHNSKARGKFELQPLCYEASYPWQFQIPALDFYFTDGINIWRPSLLSSASFPQFYKTDKETKELESHLCNPPDKTEDETSKFCKPPKLRKRL